jgi:hypothetical protein
MSLRNWPIGSANGRGRRGVPPLLTTGSFQWQWRATLYRGLLFFPDTFAIGSKSSRFSWQIQPKKNPKIVVDFFVNL